MSSIRHPVGPQPPGVYWRRRLLVGLGILAVIVVIVLIVVRPGSGEPNAAPTDSPDPGSSTSTDPDPTTTTPIDETELCDPAVVQLVPVTDASNYPADRQPLISMTITNAGAAACSYDVGTGAQEYLITSGSDRIWSSTDCQVEPTEDVRVLEPGEELSTTPFPWDRTRSSESTCDGDRPQVTGGGASYHLTVRLGEAESDGTKQFLLD